MADREESLNSRRCCNFAWIVTTIEGGVKLIETVTTFLAAVLTLSYEFYGYTAEFKYQVGVATCALIFVVLHIIFQKLTMLREGATADWNGWMFSPLGCLSCWLWNCIP